MNTTRTIAHFGLDHQGIKAIIRRHAVYNKPTLPVDAITMCSLVYSRALDPQLLGLSTEGIQMMNHQGELLAEMGIIPSQIITGIDLRNWEGGLQTAAAIKKAVNVTIPCHRSPAVTYPYYNAEAVPGVWMKFGDQAVHAYLAEHPDANGLWTETAEGFQARIVTAVSSPQTGTPILFDLNFEQMVLLHFLFVECVKRLRIPYDKTAWCPKNGGGIVIGADGTVAEFNADFTLVG